MAGVRKVGLMILRIARALAGAFWLAPAFGAVLPENFAVAESILLGQSRADGVAATSAGHPLVDQTEGAGADAEQLLFRTRAIITGGILGVAAYGQRKWWRDGFTGDFRTSSERWFGSDTDSGGADKLGHVFTTYAGTRLLTWSFRALGHEPDYALRLGVVTTLATVTGIEVLDGFSKRYRFSKEDAIMNVAGAGFAYLVEKRPELDELVDFRLLYRRSRTGGQHNEWDPFGDYSGQTYLLAFKGSGMPVLRDNQWLRYAEFAVGYNARGFETVDGLPGERSRRVYAGLSLNLSQLLNDTVFRDSRGSRAQRFTSGFLEFVQVPGTAALADHRY